MTGWSRARVADRHVAPALQVVDGNWGVHALVPKAVFKV